MREAGKARIGKRPQRAFFDQVRNLLQHLAGQFFVTMENRVHGHDMERRIVAQRPERNARVLIDVALADFDEATEFGETGKTHRDRFAGERIQNHVHSLADRLSSCTDSAKSPRRESITCSTPSVLSKSTFARAAGGGDHFRAEMERDLDRRHPDATRARVYENALALAQSRHVSQRMPRGHENDRQRRRFLEREARRNPSHVAAPRDRLRGDSEDGETKDTISRRDVRDIGSDCFNDTADFVAENARIRSIARIKRQRLEHVAKIHSGRFHFDQHLTRAAWRQFKRSETERVEMPALAGFQTQRQGGIEPLLAGRRPRSSRRT